MPDEMLSGGCLCGAIRYRIDGEPIDAGYCHCRLCQRASGAPVVAWGTFAHGDFRLESGEPAIYPSSSVAERGFCSRCGTQIFFRKRDNPHRIDITVASLDEPGAMPPQYHIWTMSQIGWLMIADELPHHADGGPDPLI
jgi:hypothetical protein